MWVWIVELAVVVAAYAWCTGEWVGHVVAGAFGVDRGVA